MTNSVNVASLGAAVVADNSGRVGINGTPKTSYAGWTNLFLNGNNQLSADSTSIQIQANNYLDSIATNWIRSSAAPVSRVVFGESISFNQAATGAAGSTITWNQNMTLDANGYLLVGTTSASFPTAGSPNGGFSSVGTDHLQFSKTVATSYGTAILVNRSAGVGQGSFTEYWYNGNQCGNITSNGANNVTYGTTSDYRLKENVLPMVGSLDRILQLNPCTYTWKTDGSDGQGFIAHELQEVIPSAVVGEKDAVNKQGAIEPQVVDYARLTPDLVKAMQEQQLIIEELKARIVALEAK